MRWRYGNSAKFILASSNYSVYWFKNKIFYENFPICKKLTLCTARVISSQPWQLTVAKINKVFLARISNWNLLANDVFRDKCATFCNFHIRGRLLQLPGLLNRLKRTTNLISISLRSAVIYLEVDILLFIRPQSILALGDKISFWENHRTLLTASFFECGAKPTLNKSQYPNHFRYIGSG